MKVKLIILTGIALLGIFSGESALLSANSSKPPIEWHALPFIFGGTALAMLFVIGIQILRSNPKYALRVITLMLVCTAYFLFSGVSAAVIATDFSPASLLFFSMGSGASLGLLISWWLFKIRHRNKGQSDA